MHFDHVAEFVVRVVDPSQRSDPVFGDVVPERRGARSRRNRQFFFDDAARRGDGRSVSGVEAGRDDFQGETEVGVRRRIGRGGRAVDRGFGSVGGDAVPLERDLRRRRSDRNRQLVADFRRVGREVQTGQNVGRRVKRRFNIVGIAGGVRSVNAEDVALARIDRRKPDPGRVGSEFLRFPIFGTGERDNDVSRFVVGVIAPLHRQRSGGRVVFRKDQVGRRVRSDQRRNGRGDGGGSAEVVERRNAIFVRSVGGQVGRVERGRVGGERRDDFPSAVGFLDFDAVPGFVGDVGPSQRRLLTGGVVRAEFNVGRSGRRGSLIFVSAEVGGGSGDASGARQVGFGRVGAGREVDNLGVFREGVIAVIRVGEERFRRVVSDRAFGSVVGQDGFERDAGDRGAVPDEDRVDGFRTGRLGDERGAGDGVVDDGRVDENRGARRSGDVNRALRIGRVPLPESVGVDFLTARDQDVAEDGGAGRGRLGGGDFGVRDGGGRRGGRRTDQIDLGVVDFDGVGQVFVTTVNERVARVAPAFQGRRNVAFSGRDHRQRREQHRGRLNAVRFFLPVIENRNEIFVFPQRFVTEVGGRENIIAVRVEEFGVITVVFVQVFQVERRVFELQDECERDVAF